MKISKEGIALIKKFEGIELQAYQDSVGVWTIGYGHTKGVKEGDNISWREKSKTTELYKNIEGSSKSESGVPSWLNLDKKNYIGQVSSAPNLSDVEMVIDTRQIVEYYSRR